LKATVVCASLDEARAAAKLINEANIAVPLASYEDGYIAGGTNTRTLIAKVLHSGTSKEDETAISNGMKCDSNELDVLCLFDRFSRGQGDPNLKMVVVLRVFSNEQVYTIHRSYVACTVIHAISHQPVSCLLHLYSHIICYLTL
jgi:hypothetical protein